MKNQCRGTDIGTHLVDNRGALLEDIDTSLTNVLMKSSGSHV